MKFEDKAVRLCTVLALFTAVIGISSMATRAQQQVSTPEIQFYSIDVRLNDQGRSFVHLTMTFKNPETQYSFKVLGRVENFNATSNSGRPDCNVSISGTSEIACNMNLTDTQKELELMFETDDFVKTLDNQLYFSGDLSPRTYVADASATLRLPSGFLLVGEDVSSSILTFANNASAHIVGDSIIINWKLAGIKPADSLKFEVLYEQITAPPWFELRLRYFVLFGAVFAVVVGFIIVRYMRRSENLVLSVLDEYERKIIGIISNQGEVKQKRIVELTELSKAKVSRVIKSLADRGLVDIERTGRTNKVKISRKRFDFRKEENQDGKS
jgi:predicted transcriptional regulator